MTNNKYEIAIEALMERRDELIKEIEILDSSIDSLRQKSKTSTQPKISSEVAPKENDSNTIDLRGYDKSAPLSQKFAFFLSKEKRFLHFREVSEMIVYAENSNEEPADVAKKLSSSTQTLKKNGTIVKYQHGNQNRNSFWGIPKWLDENGEIKKEYMYNKKYLHHGGSGKKSNSLFDID